MLYLINPFCLISEERMRQGVCVCVCWFLLSQKGHKGNIKMAEYVPVSSHKIFSFAGLPGVLSLGFIFII